jgi:hypothetical protein
MRHAEKSDIEALAPHVRQPDRDELWASHRVTPGQALRHCYLVSRDTTFVFTGVAMNKPVCMFGVKPGTLLSGVSVPWMIASEDIEFHSRVFLRESRKVTKVFAENFPVLENYVDARNVMAVRWLQWVGFSVYYPKPYGVDGLPFHRFELRTE